MENKTNKRIWSSGALDGSAKGIAKAFVQHGETD